MVGNREDGGAHAEKCRFSKSESTQVGRAAAYEYFLGQHPAEFNLKFAWAREPSRETIPARRHLPDAARDDIHDKRARA